MIMGRLLNHLVSKLRTHIKLSHIYLVLGFGDFHHDESERRE